MCVGLTSQKYLFAKGTVTLITCGWLTRCPCQRGFDCYL